MIKVKGTTGFDGNGRNSQWRSCKNGLNFILGGFRQISISDEDENLIYEEKSLGVDSEVPYFIVLWKETHELTELCYKRLEEKVNFVNNNSFFCNFNGTLVVYIQI